MSGKNKKFDRNRKRSKSMARYKAESRDLVNKAKKIAKHQRLYPGDKTKAGTVPKFPAVISNAPEVKLQHHQVQGFADKLGSITVPPVMYRVLSEGFTTLEYSQLESDVEKAYRNSHANTVLLKEVGGKRTVLKSKKAVAIVSMKDRALMAFGEQPKAKK